MREREENLPEELQGVARERSPASEYWWISNLTAILRPANGRARIGTHHRKRTGCEKKRDDAAVTESTMNEPLREEAAE
jgi:hypothetical protein